MERINVLNVLMIHNVLIQPKLIVFRINVNRVKVLNLLYAKKITSLYVQVLLSNVKIVIVIKNVKILDLMALLVIQANVLNVILILNVNLKINQNVYHNIVNHVQLQLIANILDLILNAKTQNVLNVKLPQNVLKVNSVYQTYVRVVKLMKVYVILKHHLFVKMMVPVESVNLTQIVISFRDLDFVLP